MYSKSASQRIDLSVVVVTYNHEKYIAQALKSILKQKTVFSYEILIGDDNSEDLTAEKVTEIIRGNEGKVRFFKRSQNLGPTRNLLALIKEAKGNYIAYLDGDDYWLTDDKIQKQLSFLNENQRYIACTTNCKLLDSSGKLTTKHLNWVARSLFFNSDTFLGFYLPGQLSTLVHRNFFKNDEFAQNAIITHSMIGDRSIAMLIALKGDAIRLPDFTSVYRLPTKDRSSATSQLYMQNSARYVEDLKYTLDLERVSKNINHQRDLEFGYYKVRLLVLSVSNFFRCRNKEAFLSFKAIAAYIPLREYKHLPKVICQLVIEHIFV